MYKLKYFFQPTNGKILLLLIFVIIAYTGYIQSWAFSGKDSGVPKPALYDTIAPLPSWSIWMLLLLPIQLLSKFLVTLGGSQANFIMEGPTWLFGIINIIYFYVISCLLAMVGDVLKRRKSKNNQTEPRLPA